MTGSDELNDRSTLVRFSLSVIICAVLTVYSFVNVLNKPLNLDITAQQDSDNADVTVTSINTAKKKETDNTQSSKAQATTESKSDAVPTAAREAAIGTVSEKFISPYTAKASYKNIYVKNSSGLDVDIKSLYEAKLSYKIDKKSEPQVLIMHTHTTESFLEESRDFYTASDKSRTTDETKNMVALGNIVTQKLNEAGINTLHDKTTHDYPSYNESYKRASKTILSYLKKYPSIKIVIDMHRDAITPSANEKVKLTTEIGGKKAAQIMLVMGSQSGSVTNFPNWQENLKLALKLQEKLESKYPSLARSLSLMSRNYNESLSTGSMLIEIGTDANSLEEVSYSATLLGNALSELLLKL